MNENILTNSIAFRESFLTEASSTITDDEYCAVLNVILYYIWRGCKLSRDAGLTGKTDAQASLIAQSAYEAPLAIIQLLRMGYEADAATLLRALMERIAIVGYLGENRHLITRYFKGELSPYKEALSWAKKKSLPNWMIIYGRLSGVVHSDVTGPAGHINNPTNIGNAFRLATKKYPSGTKRSIDEFLGLTVYSLCALDPLALELIQNSEVTPFPNDPDLVQYIDTNDAKEFLGFLQKLVDRYEGQQ
jgi:hypothetical protein